ncbi:MAG: tetratricopeptide repeat protein [Bacteroidia bacterium]
MRQALLFVLFFLHLGSACFGQHKTDSLLLLLKTDKPDTVKLFRLVRISREYDNSGAYDSARKYANIALGLSAEIQNLSRDQKISYAAKKGAAGAYNSLGIIYADLGNYPEALKNHFASLRINESIGEKRGIAASYNNIGLVYNDQDNNEEALKNYAACLKIYLEMGNKKGIAAAYNNIGLVYANQGKPEKALENHYAALRIRETLGDKKGLANSYNNIGLAKHNQKKYEEALSNHFIALRLRDSLGDRSGMAGSYCNIGQAYLGEKKYKEAEDYLNRAKSLAQKIGQRDFLKNTYKTFIDLDSAKGDFKGAFSYHKLYIALRDSMDNETTRTKTLQEQLSYDFEKKEAAVKAGQDKKDALQLSENRRQKVVLWSVLGGLLLVIAFSFFLFRALHISRKQKAIIEMQKDIVDIKQKEILDSIRYAKRIQMALMPGELFIERAIKKSTGK